MRSLKDLFAATFPYGTWWPEITGLEPETGRREAAWQVPPVWPPDIFAIAAKLLEMGSVYHHIAPETMFGGIAGARPPRLIVPKVMRNEAIAVGKEWRASLRRANKEVRFSSPPAAVVERWQRLLSHASEPIFTQYDARKPMPDWWLEAFWLLMVADEASGEIGFDPDTRPKGSQPNTMLDAVLDIFRFVPLTEAGRDTPDNFTSCSFANQNVVCVLPKSRTPAVGCTPRSLSHHLAAVCPSGEVKVRWLSPHSVEPSPAESKPRKPIRPQNVMKLLVVPYPYCVDEEAFEVLDRADVDVGVAPWGWFHISPLWLGPKDDRGELIRRAAQFAQFVVKLVKAGGEDGDPVTGVILPEAALNNIFFAELFATLQRECPSVETLISGVTEVPEVDGSVRSGNFVSQCLFVVADGERQLIRTWREKHHRWRLERSQIETYGLESRLDPSSLWWEGIDITKRELDLVAVRPHATMTALICEDLARVDPCQSAVRSIGPTLVVSLLMDGAQLGFRWPGRYATVLAEDPGSAVLTVSSLGLIGRTRMKDGSKPKWSVALWRDDTTGVTEVVLEPGSHAVTLTLKPHWRTEATLDGRHDNGRALAWSLDKEKGPRSVSAAGPVPDWIVKGSA